METAPPYGGKTLITELNHGPDFGNRDDQDNIDIESD